MEVHTITNGCISHSRRVNGKGAKAVLASTGETDLFYCAIAPEGQPLPLSITTPALINLRKRQQHRRKLTIHGKCFFAGDQYTDGNMCHVVLDHLARAWSAVESGHAFDLFLFYESSWPWAKVIINRFLEDHGGVMYLPDDFNVCFESLSFMADSFSLHPRMRGQGLRHPAYNGNTQYLNKLRDSVSSLICESKLCLALADTIMTDKIFVSRRKAKSRPCSNLEETEALFQSHGFTIVYPDDSPAEEQLYLFSKARLIAGFHGAGLTNLIACKPGSTLLEIFGGNRNSLRHTPYSRRNTAYRILCRGLGIRYFALDNLAQGPTGSKTPWEVNLDAARLSLNAIL